MMMMPCSLLLVSGEELLFQLHLVFHVSPYFIFSLRFHIRISWLIAGLFVTGKESSLFLSPLKLYSQKSYREEDWKRPYTRKVSNQNNRRLGIKRKTNPFLCSSSVFRGTWYKKRRPRKTVTTRRTESDKTNTVWMRLNFFQSFLLFFSDLHVISHVKVNTFSSSLKKACDVFPWDIRKTYIQRKILSLMSSLISKKIVKLE